VFKNKMYVYGLGVGLIVGAILLQLMNIALHQPGNYTPAPTDELDPTELQQQAAEYFQVFDKKTKVYTQPEFDEELQKKVQE
jgi:poly-beta-hydroxyalkanoate depolymerase